MKLVNAIPVTVEHFLPDLIPLLRGLPEPRAGAWYYPRDLLLTQALLIPFTHAASRRQFGADCRTGKYRENIAALLGRDVPELASEAAVNYLVERLDPAPFEATLPELARHLIRSRCLDRFRFDSAFLVAFDATEFVRWKNKRHCPQCLVADHRDGRIEYFHRVLDAKLVAEIGMTASLGFEFIENEGETYNKQDCESRAFERLSKEIKKRFPCTWICVLGDALYACAPVLDILVEFKWSFFLSFLPTRIPTLYAAAEEKLAANPGNRLVIRDDRAKGTYVYRWVTGLIYGDKVFHAVFVDITSDDGKALRMAYLTDYRPNKDNVQELVDKGGRQRAKIENCFNTEKNHGYGLDHVYGARQNALKNYYSLIQIAYLIHMLMLHTDMRGKLPGNADKAPIHARCALLAYRTIRDFVRALAESLRHQVIANVERLRELASKIQLRFVFPNTA